jgi:hypothetical protein
MRFFPALLWTSAAMAMLVSGCEKGVPGGPAEGPVAAARKAGSQLAYEHEVTIESEPDVVRARFKGTRDAGGRVSRHETSAEDLAVPVADADRQLEMLTRHRARLEELQSRRDLNIDQLIKLSQELAQVQTSIESLTAQRAQLQKRIDTELLTIHLVVTAAARASLQTPVRDALRSFWSTMGQGFADTIDIIAAGLPWLLFVAIPLLLLGRFLWRWSGRRTGG